MSWPSNSEHFSWRKTPPFCEAHSVPSRVKRVPSTAKSDVYETTRRKKILSFIGGLSCIHYQDVVLNCKTKNSWASACKVRKGRKNPQKWSCSMMMDMLQSLQFNLYADWLLLIVMKVFAGCRRPSKSLPEWEATFPCSIYTEVGTVEWAYKMPNPGSSAQTKVTDWSLLSCLTVEFIDGRRGGVGAPKMVGLNILAKLDSGILQAGEWATLQEKVKDYQNNESVNAREEDSSHFCRWRTR